MDDRRPEKDDECEGAEPKLGYTYAVPVRQQAKQEGEAEVFRLVRTEKYPLRSGEDTGKLAENWGDRVGSMRTISNRLVELRDVKPEMIDIHDIAHSLHQVNRFGGHAIRPYSVLSHSLAAADLMPDGRKMEGLLHDAAEAYIGDVTTPVKEMFPEICRYEDGLLTIILRKYDTHGEANIVNGTYKKSPVMLSTDKRLGAGEHTVLRPQCVGVRDADVIALMLKYWNAEPADFINRYIELGGEL